MSFNDPTPHPPIKFKKKPRGSFLKVKDDERTNTIFLYFEKINIQTIDEVHRTVCIHLTDQEANKLFESLKELYGSI